jgi:hypothetical protein
VNSAISRPEKILIALIKMLLPGDFRIPCFASDGDAAFDPGEDTRGQTQNYSAPQKLPVDNKGWVP